MNDYLFRLSFLAAGAGSSLTGTPWARQGEGKDSEVGLHILGLCGLCYAQETGLVPSAFQPSGCHPTLKSSKWQDDCFSKDGLGK